MPGANEVQVSERNRTKSCRDAFVAFIKRVAGYTAVPRYTSSYDKKGFAVVAIGLFA